MLADYDKRNHAYQNERLFRLEKRGDTQRQGVGFKVGAERGWCGRAVGGRGAVGLTWSGKQEWVAFINKISGDLRCFLRGTRVC